VLANRIALYLTAAGDLVAAAAPFVLDFGGSEKIIGYIAAILGLNAVVIKWLDGWQKYEEREAGFVDLMTVLVVLAIVVLVVLLVAWVDVDIKGP
jgi:NADH:ubiquinone oxidoreductase subunit 6 (subunit J)